MFQKIKMHKLFVAFSFIFAASSAYASNQDSNCDVNPDNLYSLFKKYRATVVDESKSVGDITSFFTERFNERYKNKIKTEKTKKDRREVADVYLWNLESGTNVKVVYDYWVECKAKDKVNLALAARVQGESFREPGLFRLLKFSTYYVKKNDGWKIDMFVYDSRSKSLRSLNTDKIVDNFIE